MKLALVGIATLVASFAAGQAAAADGKKVYTENCAICHNSLTPKLGDKTAWGPRIKQGTAALVAAVVKGKGAMPPRAGKAALVDEDIKAAVEYMVGQAK